MRLFLLGIAVFAAVLLISRGHILFLPLLLILPFGLFGHRRYRRTSMTRTDRRP